MFRKEYVRTKQYHNNGKTFLTTTTKNIIYPSSLIGVKRRTDIGVTGIFIRKTKFHTFCYIPFPFAIATKRVTRLGNFFANLAEYVRTNQYHNNGKTFLTTTTKNIIYPSSLIGANGGTDITVTGIFVRMDKFSHFLLRSISVCHSNKKGDQIGHFFANLAEYVGLTSTTTMAKSF